MELQKIVTGQRSIVARIEIPNLLRAGTEDGEGRELAVVRLFQKRPEMSLTH
jgi:hypothetical protein